MDFIGEVLCSVTLLSKYYILHGGTHMHARARVHTHTHAHARADTVCIKKKEFYSNNFLLQTSEYLWHFVLRQLFFRYTRALSQAGSMTLSTPYIDAFGAGYVLTLSQTISLGDSFVNG